MARSTVSSTPSRRRVVGASLALAALPWLASSAAAHAVRPWPAGRPAPELDLPDLDGKRWKLPGLSGQVVLLNFWATWCEPCRAEMPSLEALAARHRQDGLVVLAVNYKESPEKIRAFLEKRPLGLRILLDADGDAASDWTPRVFPTTVLIGRDGVPLASIVGDLDWGGAAAAEQLRPLLAAPRKSRPPPP